MDDCDTNKCDNNPQLLPRFPLEGAIIVTDKNYSLSGYQQYNNRYVNKQRINYIILLLLMHFLAMYKCKDRPLLAG